MNRQTFQNTRFTYVLTSSAFSYVDSRHWQEAKDVPDRLPDLDDADKVVVMDLKIVSKENTLLGNTIRDLISLARHDSTFLDIPEDDWRLLTYQIKRAVLAYHIAVQIERKGK